MEKIDIKINPVKKRVNLSIQKVKKEQLSV